ncbi:MAG: TIGR00159 family protein [Candidatus Eremiobacteraeota bacterium]|nr:TIGR00159 family protein [Candidatus Eremiobacteraeota bacterium]
MQISDVTRYVGVTDVIDILATSILIYYLLLLIRGTRAVQILIGVLVLFGFLGLATVFHLLLLGTILQLIVLGAAVTLPIVFQPELRRALEQLGRGGLFRIGEPDELTVRSEDRSIAVISQTAFILSRNRTGGLIVIEQASGLKEFVESGTTLGAQLSVELLLALFAQRSPLHDGAVIVRESSVEAAGCFLPLAEQPLGQRRLGTRHRAALGLTEQTDAVVIVISEESGDIAVARQGRLSRPIAEEQRLVRYLLACTRAPRRPPQVRTDLFAHLRTRLGVRKVSVQPDNRAADISKELRA